MFLMHIVILLFLFMIYTYVNINNYKGTFVTEPAKIGLIIA